MDVFDTLDALEDQVRGSPWVPFTRLRAVDRAAIDQLLRIARAQIERAQQEPVSGRSEDDVLRQAEQEGRLIVEAARQEAQDILNNEHISALSRQRFDEIVGAGQQQGSQHMREAYAYSAERMKAIERSLGTLRSQVEEGLVIAQKTTRNAEKNLRQREKEASREKARERRQKIKEALF
jgi:hypothetical protein